MIERRATYRVQLNAGFGFADVSQQVDYLARLGVSHVYCSPYLQAAPGSTHGYDVVDHGRVNQELGGAEGHAKFCDVGVAVFLNFLDIVPNHMAIGDTNPAWGDVLENGPSSRFASYFDVDWAQPEERLREKILLPILGDHYGNVLEAHQIIILGLLGTFYGLTLSIGRIVQLVAGDAGQLGELRARPTADPGLLLQATSRCRRKRPTTHGGLLHPRGPRK